MKPKRVIVIDPEARTVTESTVSSLTDMQTIVGGYIERATILANGDELYVNEEGLFQQPNYYFRISGAHQPFCGKAYIIGSVTDAGNNRPAASTIREVQEILAFLGKGELR